MDQTVEVREYERVERGRLPETNVSDVQCVRLSNRSRTYPELRNHVSSPSRSDSETIASRYWGWMEARDVRSPYRGKTEVKPERGAGGGLRLEVGDCDEESLPGVCLYRRSDFKVIGVGFASICGSKY